MVTVAAAENQNDHVPVTDHSPRYMHTVVRMSDTGLVLGQTRTWTDMRVSRGRPYKRDSIRTTPHSGRSTRWSNPAVNRMS